MIRIFACNIVKVCKNRLHDDTPLYGGDIIRKEGIPYRDLIGEGCLFSVETDKNCEYINVKP